MAANQSLLKAFDIIELLASYKGYMGVTEISNELDLNKSTVHRILNTLIQKDYIEKNTEGKYALGLKFIEISTMFLSKIELKAEAKPYLHKLASDTGLTLHLAILDNNEAVYIDKIESNSNLRMYSQIGKRVPVHCSAIGKILISQFTKEGIREYIKNLKLDKYTENTITNSNILYEEIIKVKKNQIAYDRREHEKSIACIAKPIYDYSNKIIAAISISGNPEKIKKKSELEDKLTETAQKISRRLGYGGF